jgi:Ca2+-binding EF-hand superfamily protein
MNMPPDSKNNWKSSIKKSNGSRAGNNSAIIELTNELEKFISFKLRVDSGFKNYHELLKQYLIDQFNQEDKNKNGILSKHSFKAILQSIGVPSSFWATDHQVAFLNQLCKNGVNGQVVVKDFLKLIVFDKTLFSEDDNLGYGGSVRESLMEGQPSPHARKYSSSSASVRGNHDSRPSKANQSMSGSTAIENRLFEMGDRSIMPNSSSDPSLNKNFPHSTIMNISQRHGGSETDSNKYNTAYISKCKYNLEAVIDVNNELENAITVKLNINNTLLYDSRSSVAKHNPKYKGNRISCKQYLIDQFNQEDKNKNGILSKHSFKAILQSIGVPSSFWATDHQVAFLNQLCKNGVNGQVVVKDFLKLIVFE